MVRWGDEVDDDDGGGGGGVVVGVTVDHVVTMIMVVTGWR